MYNYQSMLMLKSYLPYELPNMKEVMFFNITNLVVTNILLLSLSLSLSLSNIILLFILHIHDKYIVYRQQAEDICAFPLPRCACASANLKYERKPQ